MEFETDGRTNTHGNNVHRSPLSRRVDVATTHDKRTAGQPSVRLLDGV